MADKYLLEDGSGHYQLEDGLGDLLIEDAIIATPTGSFGSIIWHAIYHTISRRRGR